MATPHSFVSLSEQDTSRNLCIKSLYILLITELCEKLRLEYYGFVGGICSIWGLPSANGIRSFWGLPFISGVRSLGGVPSVTGVCFSWDLPSPTGIVMGLPFFTGVWFIRDRPFATGVWFIVGLLFATDTPFIRGLPFASTWFLCSLSLGEKFLSFGHDRKDSEARITKDLWIQLVE